MSGVHSSLVTYVAKLNVLVLPTLMGPGHLLASMWCLVRQQQRWLRVCITETTALWSHQPQSYKIRHPCCPSWLTSHRA